MAPQFRFSKASQMRVRAQLMAEKIGEAKLEFQEGLMYMRYCASSIRNGVY